MTSFDFEGRDYRIFTIASIHEDNDFIECRDALTQDLVCEIRVGNSGCYFLQPVSKEANIGLLAKVFELLERK